MISQLSRTVSGGRGLIYLSTIWATTVILIMAANTAFADFPRLGALHAGDGFLPRQLTFRGSRLVYSNGIISLAVIACGLIVLFQASVTRLIPLYAIGVFLSFTLSQTGMARRWWKIGHLKPGVEVVEPGSVLRYRAKLANANGCEWDWGGCHRHRGCGFCHHEVPRGRLDRAAADPDTGLHFLWNPPPLQRCGEGLTLEGFRGCRIVTCVIV